MQASFTALLHMRLISWREIHENEIWSRAMFIGFILGWEPDPNGAVHLAVRPFITTGVLCSKLTIKWTKHRGTNPNDSERLNDLHLTRAKKETTRALHTTQIQTAQDDDSETDSV